MSTIAGLDATRACYCLSARKAARALTRLYEEYLRPHGLRATQFSVLAALSLKGPTPVGELAAMLGLERTTLTRIAALLRSRGLVAAGRSEDGRERILQITSEGTRRLQAALPAWNAAQQLAAQRLAGGEWKLTPVSPD